METTVHQEIRGFPVRVVNTRPDISTSHVLERLTLALDLIDRHEPRLLRRMRHDLAGFLVQRFPCRGAFLPEGRECLVELTFTVNPQHSVAEIAASIVHEATHAQVARMCGSLPDRMRPREERLCRAAELAFGRLLPDGQVVVERARKALLMADHEVAPVVNWAEGARRVAAVDDQAGNRA